MKARSTGAEARGGFCVERKRRQGAEGGEGVAVKRGKHWEGLCGVGFIRDAGEGQDLSRQRIAFRESRPTVTGRAKRRGPALPGLNRGPRASR